MKKYIVEFIGTFFLVFTVCMAGSTAGNFAPIAIGSALMIMIYAGGYISGAHYNPGVSVAVMIRGKLSSKDLIMYWIAQIAGGVAAAALAKYFFHYGDHATAIYLTSRKIALAAEAIGSFAIAFVVLNVATSSKTAGNSFYGLAIGFTVVAMAYTLGPITGGSFNAGVAVGGTVFGIFGANFLWVYLVGNILGGVVAGLIYNFLKPDDN
ncbi:MAG: aquaporin [Bacteroidetes bacterium]|nr:aquaporin [Bacteroidota bacterium]MBS1649516.1 aquaporin [Bacteroidota bacterium]